MKKLFLASLLTASLAIASAQQGFHVGYKVAPQNTWMFNSDNSDNAHFRYVSTWGVAHGLHFAYHFKPTVGVGLDLIFSRQGQKFEEYKNSDYTNRITLRYLKLPILLHFNSDPEQPVMFVGQFGPQFAFLTKGELEVNEQQTMISPLFVPIVPGTYDVKNSYAPVNIGWVLGFGLGTNFGTDFLAMTLQLRFDFAFTDAEDKPEVSDDADAYSKAWYYYFYPSDASLQAVDRPSNFQATGGIEIGFKYIIATY
ncbi:MAG TPA: porin family protein [Chitinophagales bacterium]|nr:porin family protein [Chitinophagales bacterium]